MKGALLEEGFEGGLHLTPGYPPCVVGPDQNSDRPCHQIPIAFQETTQGQIVCQHQGLELIGSGKTENLSIGWLNSRRDVADDCPPGQWLDFLNGKFDSCLPKLRGS